VQKKKGGELIRKDKESRRHPSSKQGGWRNPSRKPFPRWENSWGKNLGNRLTRREEVHEKEKTMMQKYLPKNATTLIT